MSKYRVAEVMECPTCNGKGYTVRKLAWWQKFLGLSAKVPCYCSFDAHLGTHVIVTWVDLESAQQSVQPTDGGLAQADDESNLPPSSANASR